MINRFTPKAQIVLSMAKKSAEKMGHSYIGSEHLLLGLLSTDCIGNKILVEKKIGYSDVYERLSQISGLGATSILSTSELTPKAKRIIELSSASAKRFGVKLIGSEHILYAIADEGDSVAGKILISLGINLQLLKNEIATYMDSYVEESKNERICVPNSPTLSMYGKNLNQLARQERCDPLIGRESEVARLIQILTRRTKNNPCLIGEGGVGKTAIVEGLAQKINDGDVPDSLLGKIIVSLDLSSMVAGAKYRGEFEERMRNVMNELKNSENLILFIDEIHTLVGAGAAEGAVDAANIIKPALARGHFQLIGATTIDEYRKYIEKDSALERRFQPIHVNEPTPEACLDILRGLRSKYEAFHGVTITDEAIRASVSLSVRYITDRFLPDKAIDLIDEACSRVKMAHFTKSNEMKALEEKIKVLSRKKENAILAENFELATKIRDEEIGCKIKYNKEKAQRDSLLERSSLTVNARDVTSVVSQWTQIPVSEPGKDESESLIGLEKELSEMIVGQGEAISAISKAIRRGRAGIKNPKRPIGSFLFLGPTGVGKTELAKCIARTVFGSYDSIIRLDMSEYMEEHSVSKLIGSPPGYVGYEEGGRLTSAVRSHPYSVVLFDEIEKAHKNVYNILLQILEDGALTDSLGRHVDFKNTIMILTSNIGAKNITEPRKLGFFEPATELDEYEAMKAKINDALKTEFQPEFLNRLDEIIIFNKLTRSDNEKIAQIMLNEVALLAKDAGIILKFDPSVASYIAEKGYNKVYGARPIRRLITSMIENDLSEKILTREIKKGDTVTVSLDGAEVAFKQIEEIKKV